MRNRQGLGMTITTPTHGYVSDGSQSVMYSVLSNDSAVTDITTNIYDGDPWKIAKKYGVPFIVISPPTSSIVPMTQTYWEYSLTQSIIFKTNQESILRQLYDAIVKAIIENESTFMENNMVDPSFGEPFPENDMYNDQPSDTVYGFGLDVYFLVHTGYYG